MSKRVRGPVRTQRRPGARPGSERTAATRRRPASQLEAAEVIAEDVVEHRPAEAASELETVARTVPTRAGGMRTKPGSLLAARAATEYVYVSLDMRRILVVAAALFGTLLVLWLLLVILKVVALPFY
jgi:hypothetical protein